jgi:hypothetical protein
MSSQAAGKQAKAAEENQRAFQRAVKRANLQTPEQVMETAESFYPGGKEQRAVVGDFIQELLSREMTPAERTQFRKEAAEAFGPAYRIPMGPTPFESIAQNQYTANMEQFLRQRRIQGAGMAFDWDRLALDFTRTAGELNLGAASGQYQAAANTAAARYAADLAPAQAIMGTTQALGGGLMQLGTTSMLANAMGGGFGAGAARGGAGFAPPQLPSGTTPQMASWSIYGR